jgi:ABC-type transport system involved in cytochrome c biogenesis permease subunit
VAKHIRNISFVLLGLITAAMVIATIVEKIYSTPVALQMFYHSPVVIALWAMTTVLAMGYVVMQHKRLSIAAFALHSAFAVILIGAAVTHFFGEQGTVKLSKDADSVQQFTLNDGGVSQLPFSVRMIKSDIEYYSATSTPMDYATEIAITHKGETIEKRVSMNNIAEFAGYRFYQTALGRGYSVLSVCHDPWGIGITYAGYALLFIASILLLFTHKRKLRIVTTIAMLLLCRNMNAQEVLQRPLAENFGKMLVYWNGRVAPVQTMAREFCQKVYGNDSYKGYTAEQVLTGWIFYYDDWKNEPFIKIKDVELRNSLGISGKYATIHDFYAHGSYKLEAMLSGESINKSALEADEKVNLVAQVCTGKAMKIYPLLHGDKSIEWLSWTDNDSGNVDINDAFFVQTSMDEIAKNIAHGRYNAANDGVSKICEFQRRNGVDEMLPSRFVINAERLYNLVSHTLIAAVIAIIVGLIAFFNVCKCRYTRIASVLLLCYLTFVIALRWIISGHLPLTNGYETMQATAWIALVMTLIARRIPIILPMGLIVSGLALMVSVMGESNPTVSHLMPVLASPLLSIHVMLIMISYALFTIMMLNSLASFVQREKAKHLAEVSTTLLYPAVLTLAAGIFVGAIWANQSWGRYWGWDPKETWALITLFVYALPLHSASFPMFTRSRVIHLYNLFAFLSVLMTYFGVNYLLSGMHSYATA